MRTSMQYNVVHEGSVQLRASRSGVEEEPYVSSRTLFFPLGSIDLHLLC
jgi:hypothetical protein